MNRPASFVYNLTISHPLGKVGTTLSNRESKTISLKKIEWGKNPFRCNCASMTSHLFASNSLMIQAVTISDIKISISPVYKLDAKFQNDD